LSAYLAEPTGEGPFPAVLLIHEWWGLNEDIIALADRLAEQGYVVLAVDAYRDKTSNTVPGALMLTFTVPGEQIQADIAASFAYLLSLPQVQAEQIAAVGFCFGGRQAMLLGTRQADLAATVTFYGGSPITSADALGSLGENGPVLGIFGEEDASIPLEEVRAFESAMNTRNISNTITIYPGVGHAFLNSENIDEPGAPQQAWNQLLDFLAVTLQ
jgi:carboxymethylenebutenolidase